VHLAADPLREQRVKSGQRGSGDQQPLCGPAEVQLLGHRDEVPQLAQLLAFHVTRRGRLHLLAARTPVVAPVLVAGARWSHEILRERFRRHPAGDDGTPERARRAVRALSPPGGSHRTRRPSAV
jgi:hypothetical protein